MMKKFAALLSSLSLASTLACDPTGKTGIMEENTMQIPVNAKALGGISELQFNRVIERVERIYSPVIRMQGKKLTIEKDWQDPTVNAYAKQGLNPNELIVHMFGGLARHQAVTEDGFALVLCHELGHHLGGAPRKIEANWASNEGQADYFGTMKCFRKYISRDRNTEVIAKLNVPPEVTKKCQTVFANEEEVASCVRSSMAGYSLSSLFYSMKSGAKKISFSTPDNTIVVNMYDGHPNAQCRLDTYFAGSLCDKSVDDPVDDQDETKGVCSQVHGDKIGFRPLCWYRPH